MITQQEIDILQDEYDDFVDKAITLEMVLSHGHRIGYTPEKDLLDVCEGLSERAKNYPLSADENIALNVLRQFKENKNDFRKKILKIMEEE